MSQFLFFFIESSLVLTLFYLLYLFFLSRETFFQFNRAVLLMIPMASLLISYFSIEIPNTTVNVVDQQTYGLTNFSKSYYDAMAFWEFQSGHGLSSPVSTQMISWKKVILGFLLLIYFSGILINFLRTVHSIRWIVNATKSYPHETIRGLSIVKLPFPTAPFSFMNYVFVFSKDAESEDFQQILEHERIHIVEKHTIDLLYVQILAAFFWFNPLIWHLIKSLKTTHEYIADKKIIKLGYSVEEYQALLLKQLISNNSFGLVHNFNLSFIKKRITMMTNKKSGLAGRLRVGIAVLVMFSCSVLIMQCNGKMEDPLTNEPSTTLMYADFPVLPSSGFRYDGDLSETITFTVSNNILKIGEKISDISEIGLIEHEDYGRRLPIIMKIDKRQSMGFVRQIHMALRVANRRKLLYIGQTESGERVEVTLTLPPDPALENLPSEITDIPDENQLKIYVRDNGGLENQNKVYEFVNSFIKRGQGWLPVISLKMEDNDSYDNYLQSYFFAKEGYIQLYQERAQELFKKDFYKTSKEEFLKVRENIPMNISIAEG